MRLESGVGYHGILRQYIPTPAEMDVQASPVGAAGHSSPATTGVQSSCAAGWCVQRCLWRATASAHYPETAGRGGSVGA
jgi:hypothetical protein